LDAANEIEMARPSNEISDRAIKSKSVATRLPLIDRYHRVHRSLRISVTDVCNIRCQYCMPDEQVAFLPKDRHLSFTQIAQFVAAVAPLGVNDVRITGGEPLVRPELWSLVELLNRIPEVDEIGLTTNGTLLAEQLPQLVQAGLQRVNVSLDTLSEATFKRLSRRDGLDRVLTGIQRALEQPGLLVKLNALVLRDVNLDDVLALVDFAAARAITLRFIEFMPLDAERNWSRSRMVSGQELREMISRRYGPLNQVDSQDSSQPSTDYETPGGIRIGFIDTVTAPFCKTCDRLRLTSDGKIRNCLFGRQEWDVRPLLIDESRQALGSGNAAEIQHVVRQAVMAKHPSHGIADPDFQPPQRAMYQIGG
jgi:GTP 3',8-cyclase